jgi:large subunit ribosomal protein L28e
MSEFPVACPVSEKKKITHPKTLFL